MTHFKLRCSKITFEEKKGVRFVNGDEVHTFETSVDVQFEQAVEYSGPSNHGYGYLSMRLSTDQFKELGYRVGQEYVLAGTVALDSVSA